MTVFAARNQPEQRERQAAAPAAAAAAAAAAVGLVALEGAVLLRPICRRRRARLVTH